MDYSTQLDFATLALKGKRYQEAENIYMQLVSSSGSSEAWLGMALCKLYQLSEGKTIEEVVFCFNKAKNLTPDLTNELEEQLMSHTIIVLKTYAQIVETAAIKHQAAKKSAQAGALIAGVSLIAGANSNRAFGTIASLAGTGAGVGVAVDSLNAMNDYKQLVVTVLNKINEAINGIKEAVNNERPEYLQFENSVKSILGLVKENSLEASKNNPKYSVKDFLLGRVSSADMFKFGLHLSNPLNWIKFVKNLFQNKKN
jgi:hypothetical protein